ncbi:hypothetical protein A3K86_10915 [Photobacterium jeanii]|uniref:DUF3592 domain-containing protein n=1 Tax=Photobacterium jeanii TaxID=858640 RepID=A0A178KHX4_9GAMM|nr:DUF3592 domain-containing protein [Photobacterium jeanii]OAN16354.1 hypothetical protein A3K86_10915 [Photobacterium jeanii]PST85988.1 DUF3592 domain-containing protein [Photobacterium jeanii]
MVFKFLFRSVFILLLFLAVLLIFTDVVNTYKYSKMSRWEHTKANVIKSELVYKDVKSGSRTRMKWCVDFLYSYTVENQVLTSGQIRKGNVVNCSKSKGYVAKEISNYPYGSVVDVYYDPNRLNDSVLELKIVNYHFSLFLGLFLMILSVVALRIKKFRK